ncbi:MAG: flagellar motor protein MotB [Tepidisphaerales bacterium]
MARRFLTLALIGLGFGLAGCVPMDKYQATKMELEQANERAAAASADAAKYKSAADAYKQQLEAIIAQGGNLGTLNAALNEENSGLKSQLAILQKQYDDVMANPNIVVQSQALPPEQSSALEAFARQYPDLLEYDASRGVVKFKSDVTFPTGSDVLGPRAQEAISKFGHLLNSNTFRNYDFFVAGHTDNQPVKHEATIRAGHKDNWYLSAHRAISVAHALFSQGIGQNRLGVQGFAEQRPIASNATADGQARNRRVEVVILPTQARGGAVQTASNPLPPARPVKTTPAIKRPDFNKDSVVAPDRGPVLNK